MSINFGSLSCSHSYWRWNGMMLLFFTSIHDDQNDALETE